MSKCHANFAFHTALGHPVVVSTCCTDQRLEAATLPGEKIEYEEHA